MVVPGVGDGDEKLPISVSGGHNDSRFVVAHQKKNKATPFRNPKVFNVTVRAVRKREGKKKKEEETSLKKRDEERSLTGEISPKSLSLKSFLLINF